MLVLSEIRTLAAGKLIRAGEGVARRVLTGPASKEAITKPAHGECVEDGEGTRELGASIGTA